MYVLRHETKYKSSEFRYLSEDADISGAQLEQSCATHDFFFYRLYLAINKTLVHVEATLKDHYLYERIKRVCILSNKERKYLRVSDFNVLPASEYRRVLAEQAEVLGLVQGQLYSDAFEYLDLREEVYRKRVEGEKEAWLSKR